MYITMTYSVARMISVKEKKTACETHIFIFLTHIFSLLVQYLLILNVIINLISSCKNMAFLEPDNIFLSPRDYFPHGYQLYVGRDCTFLPGSMPYIFNFPLPCLDLLTVMSLGCGNPDPGKTCANPGAATTTPTCCISFIQNKEFPPKFELQEGSGWHTQSPATRSIKMKMFRLFKLPFVHERC